MGIDWKHLLLQHVYPAKCPGCGRAVAEHGQWCQKCFTEIWNPRAITKTSAIRHLDVCYCLADYRGPMRRTLHRIKYDKALRYEESCQYLLGCFPWMSRLEDIDYAVPVPLAPEKLRARGFNQVERIFRPWAEQHWPWKDGLQRVRATEVQWKLAKSDRHENVKWAFEVKGNFKVRGKHILLIDDIYTTGATMDGCAAALKQKKAASVTGLVLASGAL